MRTTIEVNDELLRSFKVHAAGERMTLKAAFEQALRQLLAGPAAAGGDAPPIPVFDGRGVQPGVDLTRQHLCLGTSWMRSPDANVLVSAFRTDAEHHARCRDWLTEASAGRGTVGLSELALSGVLRVLTHPRVFQPPTPSDAALAFVDAMLAQSGTETLRPGGGHWRISRDLAGKLRLTGNRLPDAYHAALDDGSRLRMGDARPRFLDLSRPACSQPSG